MVKEKDNYYFCEKCGFKYATKNFAEKCEDYCSKHNSCSLEIIKHAIQ